MQASSSPTGTRSVSPYSDDDFGGKVSKRKSWLPGGRKSRNASQDMTGVLGSPAWVDTGKGRLDYGLTLLLNGDKVAELWDPNEKADVYVYLFPPATGHGPSFKVPSLVLSSSEKLASQLGKRPRARSFDGRQSLAVDDAFRTLAIRGQSTTLDGLQDNSTENSLSADGSDESVRSFPDTQPRDIHLHFPVQLSSSAGGLQLNQQDIQALVDARNLFAFLTGQPLVGTPHCPTRFHILMSIAALLWKFNFRNFDGSTYGEAVSDSFNFFLEELNLGDVRESREKTIEGLILGEQMKSAQLYQEAFAHAVGKYDSVKEVNPDLFNQIRRPTVHKLERAFLDLQQRQDAVSRRLNDFSFPSIFAGIANSTSRLEAKFVNFKAWKSNFMSMRSFIRSYYKALHGQWPPKASSKKNPFAEGGLNRLVLKVLYNDLCGLYDLLVDRFDVTTRTADQPEPPQDDKTEPHTGWKQEKLRAATVAALRTLLDEYDKSSPPVQPPIPYDTPLVPSMAAVDPYFERADGKDQQKLSSRKIKDHERTMIMSKSHNQGVSIKSRFMEEFMAFEHKESRGKNCHELADMRYGHWIFLYAVIQCLPMLVIDAPGVKYSDGVEYFLCEPPIGGLPWLADAGGPKREWYGIGDSNAVVSMPSDVVDFGLEATYNRSHCWIAGQQWYQARTSLDSSIMPPPSLPPQADAPLSPLEPPAPGFAVGELRPSSRSIERGYESSPTLGTPPVAQREFSGDRNAKRRSIAIGLNKLPIPANVARQENFNPSFTPVSAGSRGTSPAGYNSAGGYGSPSGYNSAGGYSSGGERRPSSNAGGSGSTFDDILKNMGSDEGKKKKK